MYGYKRDKAMRPIIVVSVRKMIDSKITLEQLCAMADYFCCYLIDHALAPGKVECWTAIYDL